MSDPAASNGGGHDSTIVLDSSADDSAIDGSKDFVPVKPGGRLLNDRTIEISEDDDDDETEESSNGETPGQTPTTMDSRYVTSVQSPQSAFHTPALHSSAIAGASSTPRGDRVRLNFAANDSKTVTVKGEVTKDPFEVTDEFCKDDDDGYDADGTTVEEEEESLLSSTRLSTSERHHTTDSHINASKRDHEEEGPASAAAAAELPSQKRPRLFAAEDLPDTCTVLETPGGIVYLVGTAHFSRQSNDDVAQVVRMAQPDAVVVELCPARTDILRLDEETLARENQEMDTSKMMQVVKAYGAVQGFMYLLMLSMSAKLTKELGMAPGGEFRTACREASQVPGCQIRLGDRPIQITMKRALASLSAWQKLKLAFNILTSNETITKEEVERCKNKDLLESMLEELAGEFPTMSQIFVDERDLFLSHNLFAAAEAPPMMHQHPSRQQFPRGSVPPTMMNPERGDEGREKRVVVGVVGIGHVKGIKQHWGKVSPQQAAAVCVVPGPSLTGRVVRGAIRVTFYSALAYGVYRVAAPRLAPLIADVMARGS